MTVLLAFLFMLLVVAAMSIGVIFGRQPIKGSCGGLAQFGLGSCEICGGDPGRCEAESKRAESKEIVEVNDLGYDASAPRRRRD